MGRRNAECGDKMANGQFVILSVHPDFKKFVHGSAWYIGVAERISVPGT
jgi:hypothetical protein